MKVQLKVNVEI